MADVLIFDDDPAVGDWAGEVLRGLGLSVEHYLSAAGAPQIVKETRPRLVVLDIMMQGTDGLSVCRAIKSDPTTGHVKVMVVSSKSFRHDQERALRYGADAFLAKPLSPEAFSSCAAGLIGAQTPAAAAAPAAPAATLLDGGLILEGPGFWVFCDAGKLLDSWVARQASAPSECWLLLSRYPEDKAELASAGAALAGKGCRILLAGPETPEGDLQLLAPALIPESLQVRPTPLLYPLREGEFQLAAGLTAGARHARYPGATLAFRFDLCGRRVGYCPWQTWGPEAASRRDHDWGKFAEFFSGAELLVHGASEGCSSWQVAVDLAVEAKVKRLALLPVGQPAVAQAAQARAAEKSSPLRCLAALAGDRIEL